MNRQFLFSFDLTEDYIYKYSEHNYESSRISFVNKTKSLSSTGGSILTLPDQSGFIHVGGNSVSPDGSVWSYSTTIHSDDGNGTFSDISSATSSTSTMALRQYLLQQGSFITLVATIRLQIDQGQLLLGMILWHKSAKV